MDGVRVIVQIEKGYVNLFSDQEIDFITVDSKGNLIEPEEGVAGAFIGPSRPMSGDFEFAWDCYMAQIEAAQNPDPEDQRIEDAIDRAVEERR